MYANICIRIRISKQINIIFMVLYIPVIFSFSFCSFRSMVTLFWHKAKTFYRKMFKTSNRLLHLHSSAPCCPRDVSVTLVSTETLEVMWSPVKGAEVYETTAVETGGMLHCNDTSPVCALSDLTCNTAYSVTVTPCSELRGCNLTCAPYTRETGIRGLTLKMCQFGLDEASPICRKSHWVELYYFIW